jgi:integrase
VQVAKDWKLLEELPKFHMLREPSRIKRFVTPEHFAAMIDMADQLTTPQLPNVTPCQYWQAFLSFMYVTGWRLNEVLNIRRDDVDFETGQGNDAILQTNSDGFSWELVAN